MAQRSKYQGTLEAPYQSLKPMGFWGALFAGGTYTANIAGCPWTCQNCWSQFGWRKRDPKFELGPERVAGKIINGMKRNAQTAGRITGGEPALYWDHTHAVIAEFLTRTEGVRIHVPGQTGRRGDPAGLVIETNGAVGLSPQRLQQLEDDFGEDAKRVLIHLGIKATAPEQLQQLTGMSLPTCRRFHQQQLENLMHAAFELKHLVVHASFLDRFTDPGIYAAFLREVERGRPGMGRNIGVLDFKGYSSGSLYVPKRLREGHRDDVGADDPETINALMTKDLPGRRHALVADDTDLVPVLETRDLEGALDAAELGEAFEAATRAQRLAPGSLKPGGRRDWTL